VATTEPGEVVGNLAPSSGGKPPSWELLLLLDKTGLWLYNMDSMGNLADSIKDQDRLRMENLDTDLRLPQSAFECITAIHDPIGDWSWEE